MLLTAAHKICCMKLHNMAFLIHNLPFHSGILLQLQGGKRNGNFERETLIRKLLHFSLPLPTRSSQNETSKIKRTYVDIYIYLYVAQV